MRSLSFKGPWLRSMALGGVSLGLAATGLHAQEVRGGGTVLPAAHCAVGSPDCCVSPPVWPMAPGQVMPPREPGQAPPAPPDGSTIPAEPMPPEPMPSVEPLTAFDPGQSVAGLGTTFAAPNMIGDLFSTGGTSSSSFSSSFFSFTGVSDLPSETPDPAASVVGIQRVAENNSPIPRDRVFLNYSYFDDTPLAADGIDVNRLTPGFERTFNAGQMSFEARFPFAHTLDSDIVGPDGDDTDWEFGNVTLAVKSIVSQSESRVISVGFAASLPTADDLRVIGRRGDEEVEVVRVENEAILLMPFVGAVCSDPCSDFFAQGFVQGVFASEDNDVRILDENDQLPRAGEIGLPNLLMADVGVGYWVYRNPCGGRITGIAPTAELHWTRSLERSDVVVGGPFDTAQVGERNDTFETWNAVLGATFLMGDSRTLTLGFATPLSNDEDKQFDYEVRVLFNCFTGGGQGFFPGQYR